MLLDEPRCCSQRECKLCKPKRVWGAKSERLGGDKGHIQALQPRESLGSWQPERCLSAGSCRGGAPGGNTGRAGARAGLGKGWASAHLLPVGRGGPQLPPGPPLTRPYEQCLQTLQPPPRPGSPTPRPSSSTRPTSPMPLPWGEHRRAGRGLAGVGCHGGPRTGGLVGTLRRHFSGGVMRQRRPKWGPRLVSLLRGPSHGGQGAAGAQRQPPGGETNSPAPLAPSPPRSALSALVPTAVLLSLLAVAGSAGLIYVLWRRREGKGTQGCHCARPRHSGTHPGELSGAGAGEPGGG